MEDKSKKSGNARLMRLLGRAVPAVLAAGVLAACGGGGGGGDDDRGPSAQPCNSQTSRGEGFAIGSCAATTTNVFQPIDAKVVVNGVDAYTLTLVFPSDLSSLDSVTGFTSTNKPPDALRNIIGIMQGQAYENPMTGKDIVPPYVAITDFFQATNYEDKKSQPSTQYVSFGTWEKFAGSGVEGFNEGYLGIWYAQRSGVVIRTAPGDGTYDGRVVGIVGDGPGEPKAIGGRFGFSAPIVLQVAGGRITGAQLGDFTRSFQLAGGSLTVDELALNPVVFEASTTAPPGVMTGTVTSTGGSEASIRSGTYQAEYFGILGDPGREIGGRFRFTMSNSVIGVASFGAIRREP